MKKDRENLLQKQAQTKLVDTKEPANMMSERKRLIKILDNEYKRATLEDFVDVLDHLDSPEKANLSILLQKYEHLFNSMIGDFKTSLVRLETKKNSVPTHIRPFLVPRIHSEKF